MACLSVSLRLSVVLLCPAKVAERIKLLFRPEALWDSRSIVLGMGPLLIPLRRVGRNVVFCKYKYMCFRLIGQMAPHLMQPLLICFGDLFINFILIVSTSAVDCLERLVSEMIYSVSSEM